MKNHATFFIILLVCSFSIKAQQLTQAFTFTTNDLNFSQNNSFDVVSMPETSFLEGESIAGQPQLPIKSFSLLLPQGATATDVTINIITTEVLSDSYYLYPIQLPVYANGEDPPAFVEPDPTIYNSNTPFPQDQLYGHITQTYRDYNLVSISFCPFTYKPLDRELSLITSIQVVVSYTQNTPVAFKQRSYNSVKGANSLLLFPNPTSDHLYVTFNRSSYNNLMLRATDSKGALIAEYKLNKATTKINTALWLQGVYTINILSDNEIVDTAKILVE